MLFSLLFFSSFSRAQVHLLTPKGQHRVSICSGPVSAKSDMMTGCVPWCLACYKDCIWGLPLDPICGGWLGMAAGRKLTLTGI
ncbi:hypothetical protein DPMN_047481 [Dreissena polymorpha]|uniref:Uncharacterized protein n=1 Tax=Dreissena polymorpha TaxID=45954 RepID=A0A9D4DAD3_DREPO|nr:hypothetical protein DPMN_047446 [Dreissena polymorpha]KAH3740770.1 hypothetical protein DPMN_047481 [Dreissena polymorpha]